MKQGATTTAQVRENGSLAPGGSKGGREKWVNCGAFEGVAGGICCRVRLGALEEERQRRGKVTLRVLAWTTGRMQLPLSLQGVMVKRSWFGRGRYSEIRTNLLARRSTEVTVGYMSLELGEEFQARDIFWNHWLVNCI